MDESKVCFTIISCCLLIIKKHFLQKHRWSIYTISLSIQRNISTCIITLTSRDLIIFRSSHSFAEINGAIYSQLLVMNFLNSAFCRKKKKSKYFNCFISCSFSWYASFWFAFKNKLQNHDIFRYEKQDESNGNTNLKWLEYLSLS